MSSMVFLQVTLLRQQSESKGKRRTAYDHVQPRISSVSTHAHIHVHVHMYMTHVHIHVHVHVHCTCMCLVGSLCLGA